MSASQSTPTSPTAQRLKSLPRAPSSPLRQMSPSNSTTLLPPNSRRSSLAHAGTKTPPGPSSKSRARDLLRKHYGLGVGPPTPLPGRSNDPLDLDSTAFDAKSYYEQLITTSSLSALLKRENDLLTEIRQLDSERQSLVYNHHHELIAASDTIAAMKTRAEGLDADLDLLKAAFSEISRLASEVSVEKHPSKQSSDIYSPS